MDIQIFTLAIVYCYVATVDDSNLTTYTKIRRYLGIFVVVFDLEVMGVALSTLISQVISGIAILLYGKIKYLDYRWNCMPTEFGLPLKDPGIIHYNLFLN